MDIDVIIDIARETLTLIIKCSAPMLLISLVVGLVISIFQTITSIQEQTLTFVPKLIATFLALILTGGWIMTQLAEFTTRLFESFQYFVGAGSIF